MSDDHEDVFLAGGVGQSLAHEVSDLKSALATAADRIPAQAREAALADLGTVAHRLKLGVDYTVVALVGGTGSGKSSLFNALSGLDFADVGVIRPTTARAAACTWGSTAHTLLDFLQVSDDRRIKRESALDGDAEDDLYGLVLLDLPDHDSIEETHAEQVNRLLPLIDLLIWVVDPQKYADNVLHEQYLKALNARHEAMVVAINQIDTIPESAHEQIREDVRRLLVEDGLADVPIAMVSARSGEGIGALRGKLSGVIAGESVAARTAKAEVAAVRRRLSPHVAVADPQPPSIETTAGDLVDAAGVPAVAESIKRAVASPRSVALSPVQKPASSRISAIRDRWVGRATTKLPEPWRKAVVAPLAGAAAFERHVWSALEDQPLPSSTDRAAKAQRSLGLIALILGVLLLVGGGALLLAEKMAGGALAGVGLPLAIVGIVLLIIARKHRKREAAARSAAYFESVSAALRKVVEADLVGPGSQALDDHATVRAIVRSE